MKPISRKDARRRLTKHLNAWVPPTLHARFTRMANHRGKSLSDLLREIAEAEVQEFERKKPQKPAA